MTNDVYLVVGIVILVLAIPSVVSALSDRHAPRASAIAVLVGGSLVALAVARQPGAYRLEDIPQAFARVIAMILN